MEQLASSTGTLAPQQVSGVVCPSTKGSFVKWEHVAMAVLGGAALVSSGILFVKWKDAALGRKVSEDVVGFLKHHGATVEGKKISGGFVTVQMSVDEAVVNTVDTILNDISRKAARPPPRPSADPNAQLPPTTAPRAFVPESPPQRRKGGRGGSQVMAPQRPEAGGGGPPQFPEPPISGKTGMVVTRDATVDSGSLEGSGYPAESSGGEDYTYTPPMPPGMRPPSN